MNVLPLESTIVYGPLFSRRLGLSLGVNLLPIHQKICNFDCVYCHYGCTPAQNMSQHPPKHFPSIADVVREVEIALHKHPKAEYLTFSGNGEPTLHPKFSDIIVEIHKLRDKLRPGIKLAVFSNATTVTQPEIRDALTHFDMPILKLDVGDEEMFNRINHPAPTVHFADIAAGLKQIPNLITQTVFIDGKHNNSGGDAYEAWVNTLDAIHPTQAQIYSTDYPVPKTGVERVLPYKLKHIAEDVKKRANIPVQAYWLDY